VSTQHVPFQQLSVLFQVRLTMVVAGLLVTARILSTVCFGFTLTLHPILYPYTG